MVVQHYPGEINGRSYESSEELAVLGGMKRVGQCLASSPEAVNTAQRVAAENNRREKLSEVHVVVRQILADTAGTTDVSTVHTAEYHASARARDLVDQPETWFSSSTSAGSRVMQLDRGVFPVVHIAHDDQELLGDQDPEETGALREAGASNLSKDPVYEEKHYAKAFTTCAEAAQHLGGVQPVLSDVRVITKIRMGHTKRRILMDRKKAGSTGSSQCAERTTLPGVSNTVNVIMEPLAAKPLDGFLSDFGVLDSPDAFGSIPLHRRKQRGHFDARLGKKYYALLRTAQDGRGASLTWSRCDTLTLHKADFNTRATWTSGVFHMVRVVVQVTQGTADKVTETATEFRRPNGVPVRSLRPVEGQVTAVASTFHLDAVS